MLIILSLYFSSSMLMGHGIKVTLEKKYPCVIANARYHGSKALVDASVTISLGTGSTGFQKGKTDKNGNFCFYPDKPGKWTVLVDDLTGHRGKKSITLGEDFFKLSSPLEKEKSEVSPVKEEIKPKEKEKLPVESSPVITREKSESSGAGGELCCYLLKIVLGALLILVLTYIFYRYRKQRESS